MRRRTDPATAEVGFAQRRLWFIERLGTAEAVYAVAHAVRLRGPIDRLVLEGAIMDLFARHAPLRTNFPDRDGEPIAVVRPPGNAPLEDLGLFNSLDEAVEAIIAVRNELFDLSSAPLARVLLGTLGDDDYLLSLVAHHIVCDGWSMLVATRDLAALYAARLDPESGGVEPLQVDYYDLVADERARQRRGAYEAGIAYWLDILQNAPPIVALPHDKVPTARRTWRGEKIVFSLSPHQSACVRDHARRTGATVFMVLFTAYAALLHRLSEQDDIVVGTVIANRNRVETEKLVGFLVNALAIRSRLPEIGSYTSHLEAMRETFIGAFEHQNVPFELLVERLAVDRRSDYQAVFQVLFAMQTTPREELRLGRAVGERIRLPPTGAMFDLSLEMWDDANANIIHGELEYATDLFHSHTAKRIIDRFVTLLERLLARPDAPIRAISLLSANEDYMLAGFARGPFQDGARSRTPLERVMDHARSHPEIVAMKGVGPPVSYRTLAKRIEALAGAMARAGVGAGDRVGLLLERGPLAAFGYFATHWLGAIPVYLDPGYPPARRDLLAQTIQLTWCLTNASGVSPEVDGLRTVRIEEIMQGKCPVPARFESSDPAYASFTSGTTGSPRVVLVSQAALAARLDANDCLFGVLARGMNFAHCYSLNYDGGLSSLFWPITRGATVDFIPLDLLGNGSGLAQRLALSRVAVLDTIPTVLASLYERWPRTGLPDLELVITGGDVCPPRLAARHFEFTEARFANQYGPCEAVINATTAIYDRAPDCVTIGRPIPGVDIAILDRSDNLAPIGAYGEVVIGGTYLADGYLDDPEETTGRFPILNLYGSGDRRWYRSGDRARWLETGELEYAGRIDRQVQINGMRVELVEIENALSRFPGVEKCHAFIGSDGVLGACVVPGSQMKVDASAHTAAWRELFDGLFRGAPTSPRNYAGWTETASGEDIPRDQMDLWLDETLSTLRRRRLGRVLEIGSGLGLIALELAPEAESYVAVDSSAVAVARLSEEAQRRGLEKLKVFKVDATDPRGSDFNGLFDLIVVNSVLQYFPDSVTAQTLIEQLLASLTPNGRLFVGDIRDFRLSESFWERTVRKRIGGDPSGEELRRLVTRARMNDEELHLAPEFFLGIGRSTRFAKPPSILLKHAVVDNELSNYRFDVLYDRAAEGDCDAEDLMQLSDQGLADLASCLRDLRGSVRLVDVHNRRLSDTGVDPSDLLALARRLGLELILLVNSDPARFDAVLVGGAKQLAVVPSVRFPKKVVPAQHANDPMFGMRARTYRAPLLRHAAAHLPAQMVPARLVFLNHIPTRSGGKIDEETLRTFDPDDRAFSHSRAQGDLALAVMTDIWEHLLGPGPFARETDFFERGGHSLMAARLAAALSREFGVTLPVIRIFELRRLGPLVDEVANLAASSSKSRLCFSELSSAGSNATAGLPSPTQAAILRSTMRMNMANAHMGFAIELRRPIATAVLEEAIFRACARHPILMRQFDRDGRVVGAAGPAALIRRPSDARALVTEISTPLDLERDGPLALAAFCEGSQVTHVLLRAHPFAFDGDSLTILLRDVVSGLSRGDLSMAPDYATWAQYERTIVGSERSYNDRESVSPQCEPTRYLERRWSVGEARALGSVAADLGVTPAALLLGQLATAFQREIGAERLIIGCAASLRPFLPEEWRDDMIGPLTADLPLVFDEPAKDLAGSALAAAAKLTELFRAPAAEVLGQDPAAIAFSYREAAPTLTRLWPHGAVLRHSIAPRRSRTKFSVSRDEGGGLITRLTYGAGALDENVARAILENFILRVEAGANA
nr:condensation domain-containing protein [Bradyrhizobium manausense]